MTEPAPAVAAPRMVVVWDGAIRMFHWALVALIGFSWYSADHDMMDWHRRSGLSVLGLLVFRILWGFAGSSTARFATFVRGPVAVVGHIRTLGDRAPAKAIGHNPLGAISVLALLLVTLAQVVTGLFAVDVDGIESGPLSDRVSFDTGRWLAGLHHTSFTALKVLVVVHVAAIVFYVAYKRDNVLGPMITGRRRSTLNGAVSASPVRLVVAVLLAGGVAWFVSRGLRLGG